MLVQQRLSFYSILNFILFYLNNLNNCKMFFICRIFDDIEETQIRCSSCLISTSLTPRTATTNQPTPKRVWYICYILSFVHVLTIFFSCGTSRICQATENIQCGSQHTVDDDCSNPIRHWQCLRDHGRVVPTRIRIRSNVSLTPSLPLSLFV